ncbi:MAG: glycine zipper 2TM domain-containing protein [Nevskiaceae bacterium]|nr:MAG: glycine zipper 2TM domain-containing protein [Nevskiaceae bacterium]TBR72726.1 MAG: glycine zipper 2TM domain-containing protein [Nevskiaceae bacterium]
MLRKICAAGVVAVFLSACGPSTNTAQTGTETVAPAAETATQPAPAAQPAAKPASRPKPKPKPAPEPVAQAQPRAAEPAPVCRTCGTITAITPFEERGKGGAIGALAGGAAGGLAGNQFGKGSGNAAMTALGAVAGAVAGMEAQKRIETKTLYHVTVRMDAGGTQTITLQSVAGLAPGAKVDVSGGALRLL